MKRNKTSKKTALMLSAAFICCSMLPNEMEIHAANRNALQNSYGLAIGIQGEEADNILLNISEEGYKDSVPEGYTPIRTAEDLYGISNNPDGNYILMADIDLSGTKPGGDLDAGNGWTPIRVFDGILDGNGYRIKNMNIYDSKNDVQNSIAFINTLHGTVKNLGLTDLNIHAEKKHSNIGGIAGLTAGHISNCYVTGTIYAPLSEYIGGIAGTNKAGARLLEHSLTDCYADVDVEGGTYAGGIAGYADNYYSSFEHCYARGAVTSNGNGTARPVNGKGLYSSPNYYLIKNGTDETAAGLTDAQAQMAKCYAGFDFDKTWTIDKNSPYPYPQLRSCMQVRTESIELLSPPDRLTYTEGETMDFSGSKLKINYEDDYSVEIPLDASIVSYKMESGTQTVRISYNGKSAQFDITVSILAEDNKKLKSKYNLDILSERDLCGFQTYYIERQLEMAYSDNLAGKLQEEVESYQPKEYLDWLAYDVDYWMDEPVCGDTCQMVIRTKTDEPFSSAGAYYLAYIDTGETMTLSDSRGFSQKVPICRMLGDGSLVENEFSQYISNIDTCFALCQKMEQILKTGKPESSQEPVDSEDGTGSRNSPAPASDSGDVSQYYIFYDSDKRFLNDWDFDEMDSYALNLARNEIYARHGRLFNSEEIQAYFDSMPWYMGTIQPEDFDDGIFNQYEKANLEKISALEADTAP